jgi:hypothetical protein
MTITTLSTYRSRFQHDAAPVAPTHDRSRLIAALDRLAANQGTLRIVTEPRMRTQPTYWRERRNAFRRELREAGR